MSYKQLAFLCGEPGGHATGAYIDAFNRSLAKTTIRKVRHRRWKPLVPLSRAIGKLRLQRNFLKLPGEAYLVSYTWPNDGRAFPYLLYSEIIPFVSDCWPPDYDKWESLFRRNRIRVSFVSAKGSAEYFREKFPEMVVHWLPEACDPKEYYPDRPLKDRDIDLMELGRKLEDFHEAIRPASKKSGWNHVFSQHRTQKLIFPDQRSLCEGLGRTKVFVSFPKTMTHPDQAGGLETVTLRYFESIASKCVVLGHCPAELEEIFGFNPVVEVDFCDPVNQLEEIVESPKKYQKLVDRNYERLLEVGTWDFRVQTLMSVLRDTGLWR